MTLDDVQTERLLGLEVRPVGTQTLAAHESVGSQLRPLERAQVEILREVAQKRHS